MGKVYEALTKAEAERSQSYLPALEPKGDVGKGRKVSDHRLEDFDFIHFSLSAQPASEVARIEQEMATASKRREWLAEPSRETVLDLARIDPHLIAFYDSDLRASDQYDKLAISLITGAASAPLKRVLIASAEHGEGRTSVLLNLACALASAKKRVLVIDTDLNRPSVLRLLGIESEAGLAEAILGTKSPGEAAIRVLPYGFVVLPVRGRVENPAELLGSPTLTEVLDTFDPDYDFILFDSSPLTTSSHTGLLVRLTDATLLVIRAGKTSSMRMARAIAPLKEDSIFGVVLNRSEL
jgi:capsular exopolysaccharide synthesis family protein